jgi:hypothetical protein
MKAEKLDLTAFVTIQLVTPVSGVSTASNIIMSSWNDLVNIKHGLR